MVDCFASVFMPGFWIPCSTSAEYWEGFTAGTATVCRWRHWDHMSLCSGEMTRVSFPCLCYKNYRPQFCHTVVQVCSLSFFFFLNSNLNKTVTLSVTLKHNLSQPISPGGQKILPKIVQLVEQRSTVTFLNNQIACWKNPIYMERDQNIIGQALLSLYATT